MHANNLVTLAETKGGLRFEMDETEHDVRLHLLIGGASRMVLRFLKSTGDEYRDSNGEVVPGNVPDDIKVATIMLIGILNRNADANEDGIFEAERLPAPVESMLSSLRSPTLA